MVFQNLCNRHFLIVPKPNMTELRQDHGEQRSQFCIAKILEKRAHSEDASVVDATVLQIVVNLNQITKYTDEPQHRMKSVSTQKKSHYIQFHSIPRVVLNVFYGFQFIKLSDFGEKHFAQTRRNKIYKHNVIIFSSFLRVTGEIPRAQYYDIKMKNTDRKVVWRYHGGNRI